MGEFSPNDETLGREALLPEKAREVLLIMEILRLYEAALAAALESQPEWEDE
ncbi:MAG: hypothetical protein AB1331_09230 [Bacillota bacterium]